jgi:hypothetical protein
MTTCSTSSADRIDLEDLSLQQHIKRLGLAITTAKRLRRTHTALNHELENYERLLVLHRERKAYEQARAARRRKRIQLRIRNTP